MKRVYVFILLLLSFLVGSCNKSNNEFNGYLKENDNLEIIEYDYTDKIIYEANSDFNLFLGSNCKIETEVFENNQVLRVSNRANWWDLARLNIDLEKNSYYLFEASIYQINGNYGDFYISIDYLNLNSNKNENKALKSFNSKGNCWVDLKGIFNVYNYSDFNFNIYLVLILLPI